jgi:hypothetical protein
MNDRDVEDVMKMSFCSEEDARKALEICGDVTSAVCYIYRDPPVLPPKKKELTEEQKMFEEFRKNMENCDKERHTNLVRTTNQPELSYQDSQDIPEEKSQHSESIQQSHLPTLESEAKTQETACQ